MNLKLRIDASFYVEEAKELVVSSDTKRLWSVLLDLYAEFKRVCDENGLRYFADSGTMIGALRHQGFIPWDNDIDLLMFRDDYEKLCKIASTAFRHPYFWQTNFSDPGSCRGHAQLRNSDTTGILKSEMRDGHPIFRYNQGLFIDIFPLDRVPDDIEERVSFCKKLQRQKDYVCSLKCLLLDFRVTRRCLISPRFYIGILLRSYYKGLKCIFGVDVLDRAYRTLEQMAQRYNSSNTKDCAPIEFRPMRKPKEFYAICGFESVMMCKFEMLDMPIPEHADEMLTAQYGNWHKHVVGGATHGGMLIDLDRSYTEYLK